MRLLDALKIIRGSDAARPRWAVYLACGFTPLHLETFLAASLQEREPGRKVEVQHGQYGDVIGNIERMASAGAQAGVVVVEWADLDPRLGLRRVSGFSWEDHAQIAADAEAALARLEAAVRAAAARLDVALCLPTLAFPPLGPEHPATVSLLQARLELALAGAAARLVGFPRLTLVPRPDEGAAGFSPDDELRYGFPYTLSHAAAVAAAVAAAMAPAPGKKGIITDLDGTLWAGILGDDGVEGVFWDLDHEAQPHGIYQQGLHALAREGVLVGVASKNAPELAAQIFRERRDLLLQAADVFPIAAGWEPKSELVARILAAWNIAADDVIFIDDSPFELEEVGRAYPGMRCVRFEATGAAVWQLRRELRGAFPRRQVSAEDRLRGASVRASAALGAELRGSADMEAVLEGLQAEIALTASRDAGDRRALELINKTNQFNLNGGRLTEDEFRRYLESESAFLLTGGYSDKFGPLGKISVLLGRRAETGLELDYWVLSCRAFARRIEYATLAHLFQAAGCAEVRLRFRATERNGPLQDFLAQIPRCEEGEWVVIDRERFAEHCPALRLRVEWQAAAAPALAIEEGEKP